MKKIIVLGGGTSGLISALMFNAQYPDIKVQIIASKNIGVIGVGEGGTEHWLQFCNRIGVDVVDSIEACGGTLKSGIKFINWGVPDYIHNTSDIIGTAHNDYYSVFAKIISENRPVSDMNLLHVANSTVRKLWVDNPGDVTAPIAQIHMNTFKTNDWLRKLCSERNIEIVDDTVSDVILNDSGEIATLVSNTTRYDADFFIDASGFAKVLISKLGGRWISYKDNLLVNSAIAFPTEDTDEYPIYTSATAMNAGWMWNTPVQGRWGNGYVFCDKYISFNQAQAEVEKKIGKKIEVAKQIKFDAGKIDRCWIKNCVAVGLSSGFVEPLESTAISQGILQTFLLMNLLPSWINGREEIENMFNKKADYMSENIKDFIAVHYVSPRDDTPFWKHLRDTRDTWMPESLKNKLAVWKRRLPNNLDFIDHYGLFTGDNWINTLYGLQLFDVDCIKQEYNFLPSYMKRDADRVFEYRQDELFETYIPHKQALKEYLPNWVAYKERMYNSKNPELDRILKIRELSARKDINV